jgi:hypothetical protein
MNPVDTAAVISGCFAVGSVGLTAAVAFIGFRTTRSATDKTVAAGSQDTVRALNAARDDRLWDKRAEVYEQAIAYVLFRQFERRRLSPEYTSNNQQELPKSSFGGYQPPGWVVLEGRLLAYGSDEIVTASREAHNANLRVYWCHDRWRTMADKAKEAVSAGDVTQAQNGAAALERVGGDVEDELRVAEEKDRELIRLVRSKLHGKPEI